MREKKLILYKIYLLWINFDNIGRGYMLLTDKLLHIYQYVNCVSPINFDDRYTDMLLLLQGVYKVSDSLYISRLSLSFVSGTYQQGHL